MIRRKIPGRIATTTLCAARIALVVIVAMFSFFPLGAYLPGKRRNPAAENGLPTLVFKEKAKKVIETAERVELDS